MSEKGKRKRPDGKELKDPVEKKVDGEQLHQIVKSLPLLAKWIDELGELADVDVKTRDGFTPLMIAVMRGLNPQVALLLECGANPNQEWSGWRVPALCIAVENRHYRCTDLLAMYGANLNGNGFSHPPLHHAASNGDLEILQYLLTRGAKPGVFGGENLLHRAARFVRLAVVKHLVEVMGFSPLSHTDDVYHQTPLQLAARCLSREDPSDAEAVVSYLEQAEKRWVVRVEEVHASTEEVD